MYILCSDGSQACFCSMKRQVWYCWHRYSKRHTTDDVNEVMLSQGVSEDTEGDLDRSGKVWSCRLHCCDDVDGCHCAHMQVHLVAKILHCMVLRPSAGDHPLALSSKNDTICVCFEVRQLLQCRVLVTVVVWLQSVCMKPVLQITVTLCCCKHTWLDFYDHDQQCCLDSRISPIDSIRMPLQLIELDITSNLYIIFVVIPANVIKIMLV